MSLERLQRLLRRQAERRATRPWRPEWLPPGMRWRIRPESCVHPHSEAERAELFLALNRGSTEVEVLNWLFATICVTKPEAVLETGCLRGLGTVALAGACRANGLGHVHAVELDPKAAVNAEKLLARFGLSRYATVHRASSLDFIRSTEARFQFGFFDSAIPIRPDEYRLCRERGILNGVAVFHDTSPHRAHRTDAHRMRHTEYRERVYALRDDPEVTGTFESPLSRGFIALFHRPTGVTITG